MLIYAKIPQLTKMSRLFQNMNLKFFHVACCHSMWKIADKISTDVDIASNKKILHKVEICQEKVRDN